MKILHRPFRKISKTIDRLIDMRGLRRKLKRLLKKNMVPMVLQVVNDFIYPKLRPLGRHYFVSGSIDIEIIMSINYKDE